METGQNDNLENRNIPELYSIRREQVDKNYCCVVEKIIEGLRAKISLIFEVLAAARKVKYTKDQQVINDTIKMHEENFLRSTGTKIHATIESDMRETLETLGEKGMLILTNHQGGGLETFISRALLGKFTKKIINWVIKEELTKIPIFRSILLKAECIPLSRDPYVFAENIPNYTEQIAQKIKQGHIVIMSFEGTRSKNGDICTEHAGFASRMLKGINKAMEEETLEMGLMTVDTFSALPKGIEKNPFAPTGMKGGVRIHLSKIDKDTAFRPGKKNPKNIFEIAKEQLRTILIGAIKNDK